MFSKIAVFFGSNLLYLDMLSIVPGNLSCTEVTFNFMYCLLCTRWYAVKGGKTVEKREFLPDFNFQLLFTVILYVKMFVTFTYLFFFVDVDLRTVCVWTLPWI